MLARGKTISAVLPELLDRVYDSALSDSAARGALDAIIDATGAMAGAIVSTDLASGCSRPLVASHGGEPIVRSYSAEHDLKNPMFRLSIQRASVGTVIHDDELVSRRELHRTAYYRDFLQPNGIEHTAYIFMHRDRVSLASTSIGRGRDRGPFSRGEKRLLAEIAPHLRRAFRLRTQTSDSRFARETGWGALDLMPIGMMVVDRRSRVVRANRAAESILALGDGMAWRNGLPACSDPQESQRLRAAVEASSHARTERGDLQRTLLRVARPSGRRPYLVRIEPLPITQQSEFTQTPGVLISITDPGRTLRASLRSLQQAFDFTAAEARVARSIARGQSLEQCAAELGHSIATSRSLLKRVFAKAECARQSELATLLIRSHGVRG